MIWGYPYFREHPYHNIYVFTCCWRSHHRCFKHISARYPPLRVRYQRWHLCLSSSGVKCVSRLLVGCLLCCCCCRCWCWFVGCGCWWCCCCCCRCWCWFVGCGCWWCCCCCCRCWCWFVGCGCWWCCCWWCCCWVSKVLQKTLWSAWVFDTLFFGKDCETCFFLPFGHRISFEPFGCSFCLQKY